MIDRRDTWWERESGNSMLSIWLYTKSLKHKQDATQSQFLNRVQLVCIQNFSPSWSVAVAKAKELSTLLFTDPLGWGCRINWLDFCSRVRPPPPHHKCPRYDTKQSNGEAPVMLELWVMWSTPLLPSLQGLLWPGLVAPDRVLSMSHLELNWVLMRNWIVWNRTV